MRALNSISPFGLRFKLTVGLLIVGASAVLCTGYFTVRHSYQALKRQKQQDELVIAKNIGAQVSEVLGKARQTIDALARHPAIRSMDPALQRQALTLVTGVTELIDGSLILGLDGKVLVLDQSEPDTRRVLPESPYRQIVQPVLRAGRVRFSETYRSKTGEVVVAIGAPILNEGEPVGVLAGGILLRNHSMGGIEDIRIGKSGYAYIVDSQGDVVVHPQRERLLENLKAHPPVQALLQKREGVIEFENKEGVPVLAAFAPIAETGWGVVVRQPVSESYAYADQILYFLSLVLLLSLTSALVLGVLLAWKIAKPVTSLLQGVRQVADGRLDVQLPVASSDEIGELAGAFNEMTLKLRRHMEAVEQAHRKMLEAQGQLAHSEKMAAIGQLAAGLAHEVYNPLNVISGFSEFLLDKTPEGDPKRAHLEDIARETARCQRLVGQLLNFARRSEPERAAADVNALIEETLSLLQSQVRSQGIDIRKDLGSDLPPVELDRDQIKQVLLNLSLNACQAMPEGGVLDVRSRRVSGSVEIALKDTGVGIPPENLGKVFNPFFTTREEGTGLGLALSYAMVEQHGGRLRADSEPGKGATFTILLPHARRHDAGRA